MAGIGLDHPGDQAANQIFSSGDMVGSIARLDAATFNAMTVAQLRASYDVLLFTFGSSSTVNADWNTRLLPYMGLGGCILFEDNGIWEGLIRGNYSCDRRDKKRIPVSPGHFPPNGIQIFHKWKDLFGFHVVTTHTVLDAHGWPIHWDEKDVILEGTKFIHHPELDAQR